jgi:hypothetical protein
MVSGQQLSRSAPCLLGSRNISLDPQAGTFFPYGLSNKLLDMGMQFSSETIEQPGIDYMNRYWQY